jgi:hypothetical protein
MVRTTPLSLVPQKILVPEPHTKIMRYRVKMFNDARKELSFKIDMPEITCIILLYWELGKCRHSGESITGGDDGCKGCPFYTFADWGWPSTLALACWPDYLVS